MARKFEAKWNYPCCVGSIDGKHIAIQPPPDSSSLYFNYKHFFSIVLLALVDANYKFIYVDVGAAGWSGGAGIYGNSTLKHSLDTNRLNLPDSGTLKGTSSSWKFHFIGDDAFGLSEQMMKPYPHRQLEKEKQISNYRLSRARRKSRNDCSGSMLLAQLSCRSFNELICPSSSTWQWRWEPQFPSWRMEDWARIDCIAGQLPTKWITEGKGTTGCFEVLFCYYWCCPMAREHDSVK